MKKHALFVFLVLAISSTAFGICRLGIEVEEPIECGATTIDVSGYLCCTEAWELDDYEICRFGRTIYIDVYLNCECTGECDCEEGEATLDIPGPPLTAGVYILVVRVWCQYEGCECWPFSMFNQPLFRGQTATSFRVGSLFTPTWCPCPLGIVR